MEAGFYGGFGDDKIWLINPEQRGMETHDGSTNPIHAYGEWGNDVIYGGDEIDNIWGDSDNAINTAAAFVGGDDVIFGYGGADVIDGGAGNDFIDGGDDGDTLTGRVGDDKIFGQAGDDTIYGDTPDADGS